MRFENWRLEAPYKLAQQFDHLSRRLEVRGDLPIGWEWDMLVRVEDALDIIPMYGEAGGIGADLTEDHLCMNGLYAMQLRGRKGKTVRRTNVVEVVVDESLSGNGQWPAVPSEFREMEQRLLELNAHPPVPGDNGVWMLWDTDQGCYRDSEFPAPEGVPGPAGPVPVKGVDYWTPADKQEIVEDVLAALPAAEGVGF